MKCARAISALFALGLLAAVSRAQEGRVIVEQAGSKELKRTAHRLRIPADQLKNARAVLREATELARKLDSAPAQAYPQLGEAWIQLNRSQAAATIDVLYSHLRTAAAKSQDLQTYQQRTSSAQALLSAMAEMDSDHALQLVRQWPAPPSDLGNEGANLRNRLESEFQSQLAQRMIYQDPAAALKLMPALDPAGAPNYSMRGQVALQLMRTGQKDQALKIVDQVIADFQQRAPDQRNLQEYAGFVQNLAMVDPDRFVSAFSALAPALAGELSGPGFTMTIQSGDQSALLTPSEAIILNIFRGFQGRPQLAMKTLDGLPELKAKLDLVGGIDNFLNPGAGPGPMHISYGSPQNRMPSPPPSAGAEKDPLSSLYAELRGKSKKDPELVRSKLNDAAAKQDQLDLLINLAQRANYEDPDLSSIALQVASERLPHIDPVQRRAGMLQNLLGAYRQCEGEVDKDLIRNGFIIADKLRQEEEAANSRTAMQNVVTNPYGSPADQLEAALISEYSRDNFDAAMKFLRSKPDDAIKLMVMQRVLQALRFGY
jgi:hypothetical protein